MSQRYFEGVKLASTYQRVRPSPPQSLIDSIINYIKQKHVGPLRDAVDVGCGSGQVSRVVAPYFTSVVGMDVSPAMVEVASNLENPSNVTFVVVGSEEEYPVAAESCSLVVSCMAAHWFDMPRYFVQAHRVLRPGGVIAHVGYLVPELHWPGKSHLLQEIMVDIHLNEMGQYFGRSNRDDIDGSYTAAKYDMPYEEHHREDGMHEASLELPVSAMGDYITTMSGFSGYRHHLGEQKATLLKQQYMDRIMKVLDVSSSPEETMLTIKFRYFLSMGRKPLTDNSGQ
uniref:Methyltransferase DDB_G0268948 n=1 Tax=Hirondellea gigas TaxID=1518452 RepID=A0A2P2I5G2_9CRUS